MAAAYAFGETGRSASKLGGKSGSAAFFGAAGDAVSLSSEARAGASLYSATPLFKIMGAVELMSDDSKAFGEAALFGDKKILA
jgi:hypothetical protein